MNIGTVRNTIALCSSINSCMCFDRIFDLQPFYNSDNELEYIKQNKSILTSYLKELLKHINKDILYQQSFYTNINAESIKRAFDHHIETLYQFQRYILKTLSNDTITFRQNNGHIDIAYYVDTILKLTISYEKTNRIFNQPMTALPTKRLVDEIDIHLHNLQLFEDFFNFQTLSKQFTKRRHGRTMFTRHRTLHCSKTQWTYSQNSDESNNTPRFC